MQVLGASLRTVLDRRAPGALRAGSRRPRPTAVGLALRACLARGALRLLAGGPTRSRGARRPRRLDVRDEFLRSVGAQYLSAFTSLRGQVLGLYGERGIRPAAELLDRAGASLGPARWRLLPTLLWLDASDRSLVSLCTAGQVASAALMLGVAPALSAAAAWTSYLSFVTVGEEFLSFQWDALLLEAGWLALVAAPKPLAARDEGGGRPPRIAVALARWLVFRLYLESGTVKLQSGDPSWRKLTACSHHFETQPLPNRVGWYVHHLPPSAQRLATGAVLAVECAAPFLALGPRRARRVAFWLLSGLQAAIALTGNYAFFNTLSFATGLWLLDGDGARGRGPRRRRAGAPSGALRAAVDGLLGGPVLALSALELCRRFRRGRALLARLGRVGRALSAVERAALPFRLVSRYGLFAVMTTRRPEITVEGSDDGVRWREYRFRYKPCHPARPPRQVAPHHPRLDWQMWFAALGPPPGWFTAFLGRLLEGSPEVLHLLEEDPFRGAPPRYVRAVLHEYRMTSLAERRRTGAWWRRERLGIYFPPVAFAPGAPPHR